MAANENGQVGLFGHGIAGRDVCGRDYLRKELPKPGFGEADGHDRFASVIAWTPEAVLIVAADGLGEGVAVSKIVNGAGFALVVRDYGGARAFHRGLAVVNRCDPRNVVLAA